MNLKASCHMYFIACPQVHFWLHSIAHSEPAWLYAPNLSGRYTPSLHDLRSQVCSQDTAKYTPRHALQDAPICSRCISKRHCRPGGMAASEWTHTVTAVRDTPVADYSTPGGNTTRCVPYPPPIAVSPCLLPLSVSYCKRTLWNCGQLWPYVGMGSLGTSGAVFSKQWFLGFHKHKAFRLSYSSLL